MSAYNSRFERRDLVLAIITSVIGAAATILAAFAVVLMSTGRI
ncbi:hypothetical protein ACFPJ4_03485 [Lysinimonas soli]|uniref:Uncharacterized protein n=1 Tax=Lysinimonas soli TaxID=1074233 RepID=A0ABW0NLW4_9MICO